MRLRFCCASFTLLCSALVAIAQTPAPTCADLHIVPAVRECKAVKVVGLGPPVELRIQEPGATPIVEAQSAEEDLFEYLEGLGFKTPEAKSLANEQQAIWFAPADREKELLERNGIKFDASMHDE